jgi:hypothetical protein
MVLISSKTWSSLRIGCVQRWLIHAQIGSPEKFTDRQISE